MEAATALLRAELEADGFDVEVRAAAHSERAAAFADARAARAFAAVLPDLAHGRAIAEVRVFRGGATGQVHHLDGGPLEGGSEGDTTHVLTTLAVRLSELLRARADEAPSPALAGPPPAPAGVVTGAPPARAPWAALQLEAGIAAGRSVPEVGLAVGPAVRLDWAAPSGLILRGGFVGLSLGDRLSAAAGSARVVQTLALAEAGYRAQAFAGRILPEVTLGVGAQHTLAHGAGADGFDGAYVGTLSFALAAAAGVGVPLGRHTTAVLNAGVFHLFPSPVILLDQTAFGRQAGVAYFVCGGLRLAP